MRQPTSKDGNDTGQGDSQGSKTGMGIESAYALLIGVGRCKYSAWSLPVTALDVAELRKTLADPGLCKYPEKNIQVLSDEAATREGILAAVARMAKIAEDDQDATFLVYYSGHGWQQVGVGGERYFLIPSNVRPDDLTSSALPAEDFIRGLQALRSQRVLVMIDTCHASAMADAKDPARVPIPQGFAQEPFPKALAEGLGEGEGRAVFLSCGAAQKSWILPGAGSLSIFTHHLIAALQGAGSTGGDLVVKVSRLMGYLGEAVPKSAREIGQVQVPFFKFETEDFPVALIRGGKGLPVAGGETPMVPEKPEPPRSTKIKIGPVQAGRDVNVGDQINLRN